MANSKVLIPCTASDNALYLEEGKCPVWKNIVSWGPVTIGKTVHSVRSGRGPGEKGGHPTSQALIWAGSQSMTIRSDHLQGLVFGVSRFEGATG